MRPANIGEWLLKSTIVRGAEHKELLELREWKRLHTCCYCGSGNHAVAVKHICDECHAYVCCFYNNYPKWVQTNIAFCGICGYQVCKTCFQRNCGVSEKHRAQAENDHDQCYLEFESSINEN